MHSSKLPLTVWFWAAYLMATHSNGISALQLQRLLALGSYKSAWLLCAKLRRAMVAPARALLAGIAEIDETETTPIASGVATPDEVETSIGTLKLHDGIPSNETTETIYDNLDRSRALQAYLLGIPIVNQVAMRNGMRKYGPHNTTDVIWENLVDSRTAELTANDNVVYSFIWLDTSKGPLVVEIPPKVLGLIDDMWYRWVADVGITGADKGKGGKYLILPPGHKGEVPACRRRAASRLSCRHDTSRSSRSPSHS